MQESTHTSRLGWYIEWRAVHDNAGARFLAPTPAGVSITYAPAWIVGRTGNDLDIMSACDEIFGEFRGVLGATHQLRRVVYPDDQYAQLRQSGARCWGAPFRFPAYVLFAYLQVQMQLWATLLRYNQHWRSGRR